MLNNVDNNTLNRIKRILKKYTGSDNIDIHASFFALGITSLRGVQLIADINETLNANLTVPDLFLYTTPYALANYLTMPSTDPNMVTPLGSFNRRNAIHREPIAIIAMDCKYPGADNCEAFWKNCISNKESITFFNENERVQPDTRESTDEVHARGILNNIEYFDAQFFNYSPKEAHLSDPQHRLFIESAWNALEKAGYASSSQSHGHVGVYASMNDSTYILDQHALQGAEANLTERFSWQRGMSSQFLATKVAHLLNCTGPSLTVQTACSSSLVAVVLACQQLASFECDMAIAGGVSIVTPQDRPYVYQQGNIYSPDGHCRPFDASAQGTVFSNGLGVVVLKRLSEAIRDHDAIISVIKGYGLNNDGNRKMSYAAPAMQGQLNCILSAQSMANVKASSIQYVEAHGTGTLIGDPIEIEALSKAFRQSTAKEQFCAIGSVKANIGHTHVAAGIAGLIKASLALQHRKIPPALHFETPNPDIDFKHSPFYVNTRLLHWRKLALPRRAAVSAFGVGGTNAHVILEEAPATQRHPTKRNAYAVILSAQSTKALKNYHDRLIDFIENKSSVASASMELADMAYTLQVGRNHYPYRSGVVCENLPDALQQLKRQRDKLQQGTQNHPSQQKKIAFLFPGQGTQYITMSRGLYESEPVYQHWLDQCLTIASHHMNVALRDILFPIASNTTTAHKKLFQTQYTHPLLFSVEYALVKLLQHWGIQPAVMFGHSLGEYVAACVADVFSLEDAIRVVCARGKAISLCNPGAMLSVSLSRHELAPFCMDDVGIAVEIAPDLCVLSGSIPGVKRAKEKLEKSYSGKSLILKPLKNAYPFHTALLLEATEPFLNVLQSVTKQVPQIPYVSNLTGNWITDDEVLDDQYWINHLLNTVKLSQGVKKLLGDTEDTIFIEVGPGKTLTAALQMNTESVLKGITTLSTATDINQYDDEKTIVIALNAFWCQGGTVNWEQFYKHEKRNRVPLPTYPFQKQRFWIDQIYSDPQSITKKVALKPSLAFYTPGWTCDSKPLSDYFKPLNIPIKRRWIIFANPSQLCDNVCQALVNAGEEIFKVFQEKDKRIIGASDYFINPREASHYDCVFEKMVSHEITYYGIVHFWGIEDSQQSGENHLLDDEVLYQGLYSGIYIAQALNRFLPDAHLSWTLVTRGVYSVFGSEPVAPLKSGVLSLCRVLPLEIPSHKFCITHLDIDGVTDSNVLTGYSNEIIHQTADNLFCDTKNNKGKTVALRGQKTWVPVYSQIHPSEERVSQNIAFVDHGVYLITGGLGGMGLTIAQWLCDQNPSSTIVLLSRTEFPKQSEWKGWLLRHSVEDDISAKIRILQKIIAKGCHIEISPVNVADFLSMTSHLRSIEKKFGAVRGIFHLAGISGKGLTVLKKINEVQKVFRPKVQGLRVLIQLFAEKELDFFVAASSLTSIVGGVGQIDYCAANLYLDHCLAQKPFKRCNRTVVINWNAWRSVGMAVNLNYATHCQLYAGNSMTPEQGVLTLNRLLNTAYNQIIVSRYSPQNEIERIRETFQNPPVNVQPSGVINEKQSSIRDIIEYGWKETLGIANVDEKSSFYDCGGDSLALIQLITLLERALTIKISLQDLIRYPGFHAMVNFIEHLTRVK